MVSLKILEHTWKIINCTNFRRARRRRLTDGSSWNGAIGSERNGSGRIFNVDTRKIYPILGYPRANHRAAILSYSYDGCLFRSGYYTLNLFFSYFRRFRYDPFQSLGGMEHLGELLLLLHFAFNDRQSNFFHILENCRIWGFGDKFPGKSVAEEDSQKKLVITSIYLIFGMALLAMCLNLAQEQVQNKTK